MDQPPTHMHHEESENPENEENYRDRPKHDGILSRSELHPARQTISPHSAWPFQAGIHARAPRATWQPACRALETEVILDGIGTKQLALRRDIVANSSFSDTTK
jgi:hypothetical protein